VKGRYKSVTPVSDYSVSQRIRVALIDDGRTDLAVESITQPIRELEEDYALLENRIKALEAEKVKWQTESGVYRAIDKKMMKTTFSFGKWVLAALGTLAIAAIGAMLHKVIERTH
jgi:hypothetical protein